MAKIVDLIAKCEESEMFTQNLDENIVSENIQGTNGKVTFLTDPNLILERMQGKGKIPIVIWFPSDVFER